MTVLAQKRKRISGVQRAEWRDGWLFASPFLLGVIIFWLGPMLYSLFLVAQEWDQENNDLGREEQLQLYQVGIGYTPGQ